MLSNFVILGTICCTSKFNKPFSLVIVPEKKNDEFDDNLERYTNYVVLNIGPDGAEFKIKLGEEKLETLKTCSNGLEEGVRQTMVVI